DLETCRCTRYSERTQLVPECLDLRQHSFTEYNWLPASCAYRLLNEGKKLPPWHPLVSEDAKGAKNAGVSIGSYAIKESEVDDLDDLEDYIIEWLE
ncbi:MAG: YcgN family cysteine cluster protein, partial [Methylobacter sp.]